MPERRHGDETFAVARERLVRSKEHHDSIVGAWNDFLETEPFTVHAHVTDEGKAKIWIDAVEDPPSFISLHLGEFLYQLRAALDACVFEAAIRETGQNPPPGKQQLGFPICDSATSFERASRKIKPLGAEHRRLIEMLQPYNKPSIKPHLAPYNFNRCLAVLNDWARIDRHRRLHVVCSWASQISPMLEYPSGARIAGVELLNAQMPVKERSTMAIIQFAGWKRGMTLRVNPNAVIDIGVDERPYADSDVDTLPRRLECMMRAVQFVIDAFHGAFNAPPGPRRKRRE